MKPYDVVIVADEAALVAHRPGCPEVAAARERELPMMTMYGVQNRLPADLVQHICMAGVQSDDGKDSESHFVAEGDETCGEPKDACRCMKRKGHGDSHACVHGYWTKEKDLGGSTAASSAGGS